MPTLATITSSFDVELLTNGPFSVDGNLYQLCNVNTGLAPIGMFKSSDQGLTWSEQDSTHAPQSSLSGVTSCFDGFHTIWCIYSDTANMVAFIPFDTNTDLYGSVTATTNEAQDNIMLSWYRNIDAKIVYAIATTIPNESKAFLFDTGALTFTPYVIMGTAGVASFPQGAFQIGTLTYIVFTVSGALPNPLFYQAIDGSGSLGSIVVIDNSSIGAGSDQPIAVASDNTTVFIAWVPQLGGGIINAFTAPKATLVFVPQSLTNFIQPQTAAAVIQAGTVRLYVVDNDPAQSLFETDDSGAGFGLPISLIALGSFANILANLVSIAPGVGIVVDTVPPVSYFIQGTVPAVLTKKLLDAGGIQIAQLPNIGSVCKFARPVKPTKGPRVIQVGKQLTYPEWYVQ